MAVYRLSPVPGTEDHNDWDASSYRGYCHIGAASEAAARALAIAAFFQATKVDHAKGVRLCPWDNPELVDAILIADPLIVAMLHEGFILTPNRLAPFLPEDA